MALQTLGLASIPTPSRATRPAGPDLKEYGATGTPIFGGYVRELGEYNPDLQGLDAIGIYEQMRRGDSMVAGTLAGIKLRIRGAKWQVRAPKDPTPVEQEAADFVQRVLFEDHDFEAVKRNALLMLDFGVAVHEDVYEVVGNRVRLKKLADRLPITFNRWITDETGNELIALEQMGWRGQQYVTVEVPAEKLAVFTFEQEGANFTGRSLLRPMYQHWYVKQQLYKIDAIACERNGMGVPWIKLGPNAKKEDIATALDWVEKLVAHERTGLVTPPDWEFTLRGVDGSLRDPKDSIAHHNMQIAVAGLAMFMLLGSTETGSRSVGDTLSEFFYAGLDATARQVCRVLNGTTVKRLVDFNFAGVQRYPGVVCQDIQTMQFGDLVKALQALSTSKVVRPDDEMEAWVREKVGAPAANPETAREVTVSLPATPAAPEARPQKLRAATLPTRRAPRGAERCLALSEIVTALDKGRDEIAAALRAARSRVQAEIVNKLVNRPVGELHRASVAPDAKLVGQVESILRGVYEFGAEQVAGERARQLGGAAPADASKLRMAKRGGLGLYADGVVGEWTNTLTSRAANVALDWMRRPGDRTKGELIRTIEDELDEQSDRWMDGAASKGANEAFADGRAAGYEEYRDEISQVVYSALLDVNTCEFCAAADGQAGETPDDVPDVPNPDCDGGDRCRCVHVYVFADELKSAA